MGSHYRGTAGEVRALSAFINLMRAADALEASGERRLDRHGLTTSQFGVLEALLHLGPLCQGELAGKLLRSGGSVTAVVAGLEKRGLVKRERAGQDKRFVTVTLTKAGRALIERVFPGHAEAIAARLGALSEREQRTLRALCRKLGRAAATD